MGNEPITTIKNMELAIKILIGLVAFLHLYFMWFEMFAWESRGKRLFRAPSKEFFKDTKSMAANQGLYNGFLAAGLIWSFFINDAEWSHNIAIFFLACVFIAGVYGALTVSKRIFFVQSIPAGLALILMLLL